MGEVLWGILAATLFLAVAGINRRIAAIRQEVASLEKARAPIEEILAEIRKKVADYHNCHDKSMKLLERSVQEELRKIREERTRADMARIDEIEKMRQEFDARIRCLVSTVGDHIAGNAKEAEVIHEALGKIERMGEMIGRMAAEIDRGRIAAIERISSLEKFEKNASEMLYAFQGRFASLERYEVSSSVADMSYKIAELQKLAHTHYANAEQLTYERLQKIEQFVYDLLGAAAQFNKRHERPVSPSVETGFTIPVTQGVKEGDA